MTESKKILLYELETENLESIKEEVIKEPKIQLKQKIPVEKEIDLIEKKRELKRWKRSFSYYCLHPEKFKFGFKDLK